MAVMVCRLMAKVLIATIKVNLCCLIQDSSPNSPELSLLKILQLTNHHSYFLASTLDFTSLFTLAFMEATPFLQLGCF